MEIRARLPLHQATSSPTATLFRLEESIVLGPESEASSAPEQYLLQIETNTFIYKWLYSWGGGAERSSSSTHQLTCHLYMKVLLFVKEGGGSEAASPRFASTHSFFKPNNIYLRPWIEKEPVGRSSLRSPTNSLFYRARR